MAKRVFFKKHCPNVKTQGARQPTGTPQRTGREPQSHATQGAHPRAHARDQGRQPTHPEHPSRGGTRGASEARETGGRTGREQAQAERPQRQQKRGPRGQQAGGPREAQAGGTHDTQARGPRKTAGPPGRRRCTTMKMLHYHEDATLPASGSTTWPPPHMVWSRRGPDAGWNQRDLDD